MRTRLKSLARHQTAIATAGVIALGSQFWILHELDNLKLYVVETIAAGLAAGIIYLVVLYALEHSLDRPAAFWLVLAGALIFRLWLFPLEPTLSTDIQRYHWDARVQSAGWNPYAVRPDDPRLSPLRNDPKPRDWATMPGADIPSIYPPLAQFVFRVTYHFLPDAPGVARLIWFKLPFALADVLIVCMLAGWIRATRGRNFQLALYAWNPLVVVEFAGSGHCDALALAALVAAILVIIRWREVVSTLLLTAAALAKVFPVLLFPLWLRRVGWPRSRWGWINALAALGLAAACAWPFRSAWPVIPSTLAYYESRWQHNNASLYSVLAWFSGSTDVAACIGVGVVAGLALWVAARRMDVVRAAFILFGATLLLSPNAYSWYFTWVVPLLVFFPNSAWLMLTVLQFLSYHVLIEYQASGVWRFQPFYLWLTYGPFFALLLWQAIRERRASIPPFSLAP